jgi:fumarylpyruvate hydrolase
MAQNPGMSTVIPAPEPVVVPVVGTDDVFPVRNIYCVGRNYAAHAREMGNDPDREPPFFFAKPATSLVGNQTTIPYPSRTQDLHHEIELVVALEGGGINLYPGDAEEKIYGYAVGNDLTRRDLQAEAKKMGRPWVTGKGFDHSAPMTAIHPVAMVGHPDSGEIWLDVNGERRQQGDLKDLIWSVPEIIAELSTLFELRAGDLIFTGTPAGVGPVQSGDLMTGGVAGLEILETRIG